VVKEPSHSIPRNAGLLTTLRQGTVPEPGHPEAKHGQRSVIHGNPVIAKMSPNHRLQPLSHHWNRIVPAMSKLRFHLAQLRLQPLPHRLPKDRERAILEHLESGPATEDEIRKAVGGNTGAVGKARRELRNAGTVYTTGKGRRSNPYRYEIVRTEGAA